MRASLLLILSIVFMTFAWSGHVTFKSSPIWIVIFASWGIAFFEYCLQVPANRLGSAQFSVVQLKMLQEIITLTVFVCFSAWYFKESFRWNHGVSFLLLIGAVFFAFKK